MGEYMSDGEACAARFMFNFVRRLADIVVFTRQLLFELFELGLGWFFFFFFFPLTISEYYNVSQSLVQYVHSLIYEERTLSSFHLYSPPSFSHHAIKEKVARSIKSSSVLERNPNQ